MIYTRQEMKKYALSVCLPMLEKAAERRLSHRPCEVVDTVGYIPTHLEEMFRPFWGITPILREEELYLTVRGKRLTVGEWLREVLVSATDPQSTYYWNTNRDHAGAYMFDFQNMTEVAGLLVGCFFARERTWDVMSEKEQKQVADYIISSCATQCERIPGNNHIWFPLLCLLVLRKFGFDHPDNDRWFAEGLSKLDGMYIGGGWYSDGAFGRIDYYEAWSMHSYPLLWCLIEDESCPDYAARRKLYLERTTEFLRDYIYFFDINGAHPPFGRSLSYRFAASCVFPLAVLAGAEIDPALAGEITRRNVSYFADHCLLGEDNILPPGYLYNAPALIASYTSSGGPYWAAKTFLCLLLPEDHPFWQGSTLPIDKEAYCIKPSDVRLNFAVSGDRHSGVTVYNNHFQCYQNGRYCNAFNDMASCYHKFCYNSRAGFALATRDCTASDNMISLLTRDGSMTSHRWGFTDLGCRDGWMVSEQIPFANDPETVIRTYLLPLEGSLHVRVHRVTLSREYAIREGGFSLGLWDDYRESKHQDDVFLLWNRTHVSILSAHASVPFCYGVERPQPGMHLLAPYAVYPAYSTALLSEGTYWFAATFGICDRDMLYRLPDITLQEDGVYVEYNGIRYTVSEEKKI